MQPAQVSPASDTKDSLEARILAENKILRTQDRLSTISSELEDLRQLTRTVTTTRANTPFKDSSFYVQAGGTFLKQSTKDLYKNLESRISDLMNEKKILLVELDRLLVGLIKVCRPVDYASLHPVVYNQLEKYNQRIEEMADEDD